MLRTLRVCPTPCRRRGCAAQAPAARARPAGLPLGAHAQFYPVHSVFYRLTRLTYPGLPLPSVLLWLADLFFPCLLQLQHCVRQGGSALGWAGSLSELQLALASVAFGVYQFSTATPGQPVCCLPRRHVPLPRPPLPPRWRIHRLGAGTATSLACRCGRYC